MYMPFKIILTLDYETWQPVPQGKIIDWQKDLFESTTNWLQVAKKYQAKLTFFIDMGEYYWLKEHESRLALQMEHQIQEMVRQGHDVQLHLHPSWLPEFGVAYKDGKWIGLDKNQRLHDLHNVSDYIKKAKSDLEAIAAPVDSSFRIVAFRAPGYQIQPSIMIVKALLEAGIYVDSSVCKGLYLPERKVDFRYAYHRYQPYFADPYDIRYQDVSGNKVFLEMPILSYQNARWNLDHETHSQMLAPLKKTLEHAQSQSEDEQGVFVAVGHTKYFKSIEVLDQFFNSLSEMDQGKYFTVSEVASCYLIDKSASLILHVEDVFLRRVKQLTQWCYQALDPARGHESYDPVQILKDGYALCAGYVAVMAYLLNREGFKHRLWSLVVKNYPTGHGEEKIDTHEVLEVWIQECWYLIDPTLNIVYGYSLFDMCLNPHLVDIASKSYCDERWMTRRYNLYACSLFYQSIFSLGVRSTTHHLFTYFDKQEFIAKNEVLYASNYI